MTYFIGVDVGSSSVRAGLFSAKGKLLSSAVEPITIWEPKLGYYEQSSDDVWNKVCLVVKAVSDTVDNTLVKGIGFDATCSLVVMDTVGQPLTISPSGSDERNIIMWMDHRAHEQAEVINRSRHKVLDYVGGVISLEMEMPKLMWLKQNMPESWSKAGHFFDLPDFLTWKSTGQLSRSLCSLVCKWNYLASHDSPPHWPDDFLQLIGLEDLVHNNYSKIGNVVKSPGELCGHLTEQAAQQMGLCAGVAVATSMIDAHAGGLGVLSCSVPAMSHTDIGQKMALICGTSTCHMTPCSQSLFVPGVWGPYHQSIVPGYWSLEPGQSAAGKLIDHIVTTHVAYSEVKQLADKKNQHVHVYLNNFLREMASKHNCHMAELTRHLHMWPDYHGNRSPIADPSLTGMLCGLRLSSDVEDLAKLYLTTIQALACGTKHIIDTIQEHGHTIKVMCACGGLSKNSLYVQVHADVTKLPIILPHNSESVLLGSAILGACASGEFRGGINEAMENMGGEGDVVKPDDKVGQFYEKKYEVFLKMVEHQREYRTIMDR